MRIFERFPKDLKCPVCGREDDAPSVLIPIEGTETKPGGLTFEAVCIHVECIDLWATRIPEKYLRLSQIIEVEP